MDEPKKTLDLRINKNKLDEEIIRLPADFYDAYKGEVKAIDERDSKKNHLEVIRQKEELKIRKMPKEEIAKMHGLTSLTESAIKALVNQEAEVKKCEDEYLDARRVANLWKALREAIEKKYKMVEVYSYLLGKEQTMRDFHLSKEVKFIDRIGGEKSKIDKGGKRISFTSMGESMRKKLEEL